MRAWTLAACLLVAGCGRPPQMGADEEVFRMVDALYTAVTSRSEPRLAECEKRLKKHRDEGKLPATAAAHLDGIVSRARGGGWESAASRLHAFMREQRREGQEAPPPPKKGKGAKR